jgi:FtsZ-binding cell division protein ZapB
MQSKVFDRLEEQVEQAVQRIHELSRERRKLDEKLQKLNARNKDLALEVKALSKNSISRSEFEERKKLLEERVSDLLRRFEELDQGGETAAAEAT